MKLAPRARCALLCLVLSLATLGVYAQTFDFAFVDFDDHEHMAQVPDAPTLGDLGWTLHGGDWMMWHPLTWASYMADARLFGKNSAGPFHRTNVALHILATLGLFLGLRRATRAEGASAFVAAVFALHPLHVESVAWVSERKDVLSGLFWMLAMWAYVAYAQTRSALSYTLAVTAFALGLASKPTLVTFPFALLLLDYWPLRRSLEWRLLVEKIPFLLLVLGVSIISIASQESGGSVVSLAHIGIGERLANALVSYALYLLKSVWPLDPFALAPFYPHPTHAWLPPMPAWKPLASFAGLLAITGVCVWRARAGVRYWAVGWLWFLGTLVPMIGLMQVGSAAMADRYSYIPQVGLVLALAWGGAQYASTSTRARILVSSAALVVLTTLGVLSFQQASYWRDGPTLFARAIEVTGPNPLMQVRLARELETRGKTGDALQHYGRAHEIDPIDPEPAQAMARIRRSRGQLLEAGELLDEVVRIHPSNAEALYALAEVRGLQGRLAETAALLERVLQLGAPPELLDAAQTNLQRLRRELAD